MRTAGVDAGRHCEPASRYGSVGLPWPAPKSAWRSWGRLGKKTTLRLVGDGHAAADRSGGRPFGGDCLSSGEIATGDCFAQDADGYLYFHGRLSDFIVRDDNKICLAAVRRAAGRLPRCWGPRHRSASARTAAPTLT